MYLIGLPLASIWAGKDLLRAIAAVRWVVTFGLSAGWGASISSGQVEVNGSQRLAAYVYGLNLYLSSLIALGTG
ncbi:MAG: hypothetical protein WBR18_01980 [Anaerolineales bacterium]